MNTDKIKEFFNEIILDKFIVNFVPGLILFYTLTLFIKVSIGEGLISFLIVTSSSWVLGIILELIVFRKTYLKRRENTTQPTHEVLKLLYGKIGVSIIIASLFTIDLKWILELFDYRTEDDMKIIRPIVKLVIFISGGILLYRYYRKNRFNSN